ncbi:hypothetical protein RDWZM_001270 [Blomia tropicalis]|uniref:Protein kinase domain-containing protein n=1 Tax=Blomia tropicalis TaxID=40697 RepID=A0A9Q0MFQ3_BLOTA|nr:hypothetical protein RDWZM_001270 [Blomia tropicalis]
MDIIKQSKCLNGTNNGTQISTDMIKESNNSFGSTLDNISDHNSNHSFNSVSSTPNSMSTPSPSSIDHNIRNSGFGPTASNNNQPKLSNGENLNNLSNQYQSILMNQSSGNNLATDSFELLDNNNILLNGFLQEMQDYNRSNHHQQYNGLVNNKNRNNSLVNEITNRKKSSSMVNNSPIINSKSNTNTNSSMAITMGHGLDNYPNKCSTPNINCQPTLTKNNMNIKGKTVLSIIPNSKSRLVNGEIGTEHIGNSIKFPLDSGYSNLSNSVNLNGIHQSQYNQMMQPQQGINNLSLISNNDNYGFINQSDTSSSFLSNATTNTNISWAMNSKNIYKQSAGTTASSAAELFPIINDSNRFLKNGDQTILNSNNSINVVNKSNNKFPFITSPTTRNEETNNGLKNGHSQPQGNLDFLSEMTFSNGESRNLWNANSESANFFNNANPSSATSGNISASQSNTSASIFNHVWSNNTPNEFNSWPTTFGPIPNLGNESKQTVNLNNSLMTIKGDKINSFLVNANTNERKQVEDLLVFIKRFIFEESVCKDFELCQKNLDLCYEMVKSSLKKFDSTRLLNEELKPLQQIYSKLLQSRSDFQVHRQSLDVSREQLSYLMTNFQKDASLECEILQKIIEIMKNNFGILHTAKFNPFFLDMVKFYKNMVYSFPMEILENLPLLMKYSEMLTNNSGNLSDPLFAAYRNLIMELNNANINRRQYTQQKQDLVNSNNNMNSNANSTTHNDKIVSNDNKDVNNNKKIENYKDIQKILNQQQKESDLGSKSMNNKCSDKIPPIFEQVTQLKNEPGVYMPFYYPMDHHMLCLSGPISLFYPNRIRMKTQYYIPSNRQTIDHIIETELPKSMSGPIVVEKMENLNENKSFRKLISRLRKHFPNLSISQLKEMVLQSKHAIMKKHKLQYGFSGFKLKDLVNYVTEYIIENAIAGSNVGINNMKINSDTSTSVTLGKGVSWSMVASNQAGQSLVGTKDSVSVASTDVSTSPSPSPSSSGNNNPLSAIPLCACCMNPSSCDGTNMTIASCGHIFHNKCFDEWTKMKPSYFSHRLSSIANDQLINLVQLPIQLEMENNSVIENSSNNVLTINTPTEFFHSMGYRNIKKLGRGAYGTVILVEKYSLDPECKDETQIKCSRMACKIIMVPDEDDRQNCRLFQSLRAELYVLQGLRGRCPNVIEYYEHYVIRYTSHIEQQNILMAHIFMEFADAGCMVTEVAENGPLSKRLSRRYFAEMANGLAFMHRNQIAHNDFKLDNVLLIWDSDDNSKKHCKLTDFGMARFAWKDGVGLLYSNRHCGTRHYMAPEVIRCGIDGNSNEYVPFSADIWSLGVSLYIMLMQEFPYDIPRKGRKYDELLKLMKNGVVHAKEIKKKFESNKLAQLLCGMLEYEPNKRFTISEVVSSPWINNNK